MVAGIDHLQMVGEELVQARNNPHDLLKGALADLAHRADLGAGAVKDRILVVDFDELGLLVNNKKLLIDQAPTGDHASLTIYGRTAPFGIGEVLLDLPGNLMTRHMANVLHLRCFDGIDRGHAVR